MLGRSSGGGCAGPGGCPGGDGLRPGVRCWGGRAMGGGLMAREWDVAGYTEVKALGSGGFGEVVLARHEGSGVLVAIKYLRGQLLAAPGFAAAVRPEPAVLPSLCHPIIARS